MSLPHLEGLLIKDNQMLHFLTRGEAVQQKNVKAKLDQSVSLGDVVNTFLHNHFNMSLHACVCVCV